MVRELDIRRSAALILKTYGDTAPMICAELVDRWAKRGDQDASDNWRRIKEAASALTEAGSGSNAS